MFESAAEALKYISEHDVVMVDLKVAAVSGQWLHLTNIVRFSGGRWMRRTSAITLLRSPALLDR